VDQAKGAAERDVGNAKDAAKRCTSRKDAAIVKTHETRDKISQSVQNAKESQREDRQIQGASFRVMRRGFQSSPFNATLSLFKTLAQFVCFHPGIKTPTVNRSFNMKNVGIVGVLLLVLDCVFLSCPYLTPRTMCEDRRYQIGVQTQSSEKIAPAVGIILLAEACSPWFLGSRKS